MNSCEAFFAQLYQALWEFSEAGRVHSKPHIGPGSGHPEATREQLHASHPDWNLTDLADWDWQILGTPTEWRMRIWDDRLPGLGRDRPYDVIPYRSPLFLAFCEEFYDPHHPNPDKRMHYCVGSLVVDMEEKLLGQAEALQAYADGAPAADPPQIYDVEDA